MYQDNLDGSQKWKFKKLVTENACSKLTFERSVADGLDPTRGKWLWRPNGSSFLSIRCLKEGVDVFENGIILFQVKCAFFIYYKLMGSG